MKHGIAIVGMACCYPDARNPRELWENVLARRRAFRRIPPERLCLRDYLADAGTPDTLYSAEAALIEAYEFDRVRFRVSGPIYRSVDLVHWLALDVADQALKDAGIADPDALPRETTGVLLGNTLTGEFSRAATLRLRWPYVRRLLDARLRAEQWDEQHRLGFLCELEQEYKAPFAPVGEETLAGALSNTIAGRICNYFHLGGGGYTVDGACCSSLLAVARSCSALEAGELDLALAGGVDLSLDPFELVGFAKAGALARGEMRIYDRDSNGFLPGEGAGFAVLMRHEDAVAQGKCIYAVLRGWGISSDGSGSITRPEMHGQMLAMERAYRHAGYGPETVALFEGHGTGTPVGDEVELQSLDAARRAGGAQGRPAALGSIKANFGHTKAAAGIAGLIKATLALHYQILPPTTGVQHPRPELEMDGAVLRVLPDAELWPQELPLRAGVNSFGFGGINVHVTLESEATRRAGFSPREELLLASAQDAELFLLEAESNFALAAQAEALAKQANGWSCSDLGDVSAALAIQLTGKRWRAGIVAGKPSDVAEGLERISGLLGEGTRRYFDSEAGLFLGVASPAPRIGFLFPGQASPVRLSPGIFGKRFAEIRDLYQRASLSKDGNSNSTDIAQPAIIAAELGGLRLLNSLGIEASLGIGHSLGELAAYHWAGAVEESPLLNLVATRGRLMAGLSGPAGAMANISAPVKAIRKLIAGEDVVLACLNGPDQNVVSGETNAVLRVVRQAQDSGWSGTVLTAGHAFHSPLMAPVAEQFEKAVYAHEFGPVQRRLFSTISSSEIDGGADLRRMLVDQLTEPVRFAEAAARASKEVDLFIEVGPGRVLTHLIKATSAVPSVALDIAGPSLRGVLQASAAAYVMGAAVRTEALFAGRFTRPFDLERQPSFFVNPCELAPASMAGEFDRQKISQHQVAPETTEEKETAEAASPGSDAMRMVRTLVAQRTELPEAAIDENARLLRDLHLNSIVVAEIVAAAARKLNTAPPARPLKFADATVGELAQALAQLRENSSGPAPEYETVPAGVSKWTRAFTLEWRLSEPSPYVYDVPGGHWRIVAATGNAVAEQWTALKFPGTGVIVCLDGGPVEEQASLLLEGAHAALDASEAELYFAIAGPEASTTAAFARTLHLENPHIFTRIIDAPLNGGLGALIARELSSTEAHLQVRYDATGQRWEPAFNRLTGRSGPRVALGQDDVILASGGGKGVVAKCISAVARETGARLVILGRSKPQEDPELAGYLHDLAGSGVKAKYISADISDPGAVHAAVQMAESAFGRVTGIVHGAGRNEPKLLRDLDQTEIRRTLTPKVQGLRNLLAAVGPGQLRFLFSFGSVIGRTGLRGEAHYALANGCLVSLTENFARRHPACHCVAFESSAWSDIGMAERLGAVESLLREGIETISPDEGVSWFRDLLMQRMSPVAIVVTARLGAFSPLPVHAPHLPLLRFLERPRVYYPGVELVVDSDLTTGSDPYLLDHVFHGQPLLPGVMGLEAIAQAAMAVAGESRLPVFETIGFDQPVAVQPGTRITLRLAALVRDDGSVEVVLRSSATSFAVDHFHSFCRFEDAPAELADTVTVPLSRLAVEPERELYGSLLFQTGRFRRLAGYRDLSAEQSWAEIAASGGQPWFSPYLPPTLLLGDAGARDAAIHSIQACVPHAVLLPAGIEQLKPACLDPGEPLLVHARERWQDGNTYCYDVELRNGAGVLRESWSGLKLHKVADAPACALPDALVAVSLQRRVREMGAATELAAAFERDQNTDRRHRSERAIQRALHSRHTLQWRADGKPEVQAAISVSAAHMNGLTLAVAGPGTLACDLEQVATRPDQVWRDLLGVERWRLAELIANQAGEDMQTSATRVWTAIESLKKAGAPEDGHLMLHDCSHERPGLVSLKMGNLKIATAVVRFRDDPHPAAVSILTGN
jgi:enediyne polyketide synthase